MPHRSSTISVQIIKLRLQIAHAYGIDVEQVLQRVGLTSTFLNRPLARVTVEQDRAVWRELVALSGDTTLGLKFGNQFQLNGLGVLGYILLNSPTMAQALRLFSRYEHLVADIRRTRFVEEADSVAFVFSHAGFPDDEAERYVADWVIASVKVVTYNLVGVLSDSVLKAVHFKYPRPPELETLSVYREIFGDVTFRFNCPDTRCVFSTQLLTMPIIGANPDLLTVFEAQGQELIEQYHSENWSDRVRLEIIHALKGELPTLGDIATKLTLSTRSLQLKLQAENTSFQDLLNGVRQEMAMELLRKKSLNKTEIAYLLGFSGASAFSRTFKKWTGRSPSAFQKQKTPLP
ncbi:MAG: AraC family transcriptional regulator [Spirulina sp. SIO3F2]|nr:AraC family transcriptional regulator [Spirulina sp. SIO3F2]